MLSWRKFNKIHRPFMFYFSFLSETSSNTRYCYWSRHYSGEYMYADNFQLSSSCVGLLYSWIHTHNRNLKYQFCLSNIGIFNSIIMGLVEYGKWVTILHKHSLMMKDAGSVVRQLF